MPEAPDDMSLIFISYARGDADFALQLGDHLRSAGAAIWMDQTEIRAGNRWDVAVQEALKECPRLLVILSPASVSSQNVLDEVRYALDAGKEVIPVLYRDCELPFWLRRLQRVDVRAGLANLSRDMHLLQNTNAKRTLQKDADKTAIRLIDCQVPAPIAAPGDQLQIDYILHNSSSVPITVWLGASLVKDGREFSNSDQDKVVQIDPGRHTATRFLTVANIPIRNRADDVAQLIAVVCSGPKSNFGQSLRLATSSKIPIIILPG